MPIIDQLLTLVPKLTPERANALILEVKESELQKKVGPLLRRLAVNHLSQANTPVIQRIRDQFNEELQAGARRINFANYLKKQSVDREWATEVEACALADLFNVSFVARKVRSSGRVEYEYKYYDAGDDRPVVCLYNQSNIHWFYHEHGYSRTIGNGDCLFNAFAQAIRDIALHEKSLQEDNDLSQEDKDYIILQQEKLAKYKAMELQPPEETVKQAKLTFDKAARAAMKVAKQADKEEMERQASVDNELLELLEIEADSVPAPLYDIFAEHIEAINLKALAFGLKKGAPYQEAKKAAEDLYIKLKGDYDKLKSGELKYDAFKNNAMTAIKGSAEAKVLSKHRGCKEILCNIGLAVLMLGVGYLVAGAIKKGITGKFSFFVATDSRKKLDNLVDAIENFDKKPTPR